jgi:hypothetical protein
MLHEARPKPGIPEKLGLDDTNFRKFPACGRDVLV